MNQRPSPLAAFHLIGERPEGSSGKAEDAGLWPALFGAYRDLSGIRYDYPLVLLRGTPSGDSTISNGAGNGADNGGEILKSLSDITDGILLDIAPRSSDGEQIRRQLLGLEQEIRGLVAGGRKRSLSQLWDDAQHNMMSGAERDARKVLSANLQMARSALKFDGEVVDCDENLPIKLVSHAWAASGWLKTRQLGARIDELAQNLSDILRVDFLHSEEARGERHLQESVGPADQTVFDFKAMSRILRSTPVGGPLPGSRQRRIRAAISALESQQFVATANGIRRKSKGKAAFAFDNCDQALTAFRDRLPDMTRLVKAISIAELEIENRYDERRHDAFFERFDDTMLGPEDLAMFPSYLVCLAEGVNSAAEQAALFELLCAGLPIKIVVQSNDILEDLTIGSGQLSFGTRGQQIANMAVGLNNTFVMQSAASSLYRLRTQVLSGLANDRPALFSIFSGCDNACEGVPAAAAPYLRAAAATEARAFPCFVYDPGAGEDRVSRFKLDGNPQAEADWPLHLLQYEDSDHNRLADKTAFTFVDFVASNARYAKHFAAIPQSDWHDGMVPVSAFLEEDAESGGSETAALVPYILVIDDDDNLARAIVDEKLINGARNCRDLWRRLQHLGGLNDDRTAALLAKAKEAWEDERQRLTAAAEASSPPTGQDVTQPAAATEPASGVPEPMAEAPGVSAGDPYIETARCTTCNECTEINSQMFAYNEDMQAYIKDSDAGTYRQMVEAAEACQVCIIHPGMPRNQNEANLDELIARAEPFNASP